jgi:hypothetical protein
VLPQMNSQFRFLPTKLRLAQVSGILNLAQQLARWRIVAHAVLPRIAIARRDPYISFDIGARE